jgi:hypothetical protein
MKPATSNEPATRGGDADRESEEEVAPNLSVLFVGPR